MSGAAAEADGMHSNPFAVARVRPGAIPYRFPPGKSAATLVDALLMQGGCGAIVGPHGSGKSTLLAIVQQELQARDTCTELVTLRSEERRLPKFGSRQRDRSGRFMLIVDGFEQLRLPSRVLLRLRCWRRGWGLLVTQHRSTRWPTTIWEMQPRREDFYRIVRDDLRCSTVRISDQQLDAAWRQHAPDVREALFVLYDLYEAGHH